MVQNKIIFSFVFIYCIVFSRGDNSPTHLNDVNEIEKCPSGFYYPDNVKEMEKCPGGYYCPGDGKKYECPDNTYSYKKAKSIDKCIPCGCKNNKPCQKGTRKGIFGRTI